MAGLPMISLYDPKEGAHELERCAKMGLKGAMIWCSTDPESASIPTASSVSQSRCVKRRDDLQPIAQGRGIVGADAIHSRRCGVELCCQCRRPRLGGGGTARDRTQKGFA